MKEIIEEEENRKRRKWKIGEINVCALARINAAARRGENERKSSARHAAPRQNGTYRRSVSRRLNKHAPRSTARKTVGRHAASLRAHRVVTRRGAVTSRWRRRGCWRAASAVSWCSRRHQRAARRRIRMAWRSLLRCRAAENGEMK